MALSPPSSLAQLESSLRDRLWRGDMLVATKHSISSGFAALDAQLPGNGWPTHCLTELLCPTSGLGELRLIAPALSQLVKAGRQVVMLLPTEDEHRLVYPDGWSQLGIDPGSLLMIRARRPADRLWAIEQTLKSASFGALLGWVDPLRPEALRRLQVAAASADGLSFLFRPQQVQHQASPAPLRMVVGATAHVSQRRISVNIIKRRGPVLAGPLYIDVALPRSLRPKVASQKPVATPVTSPLSHALGRPLLSDTAPRSYSTSLT
jgi:protein ImuA